MRKIIFRGKLTTTGEWAEGFLVDAQYIGNRVQCVPVDPKTVGQFTGLHDKNGRGIFEGDICTYPDGWVDNAGDGVETFSIGVVAWDEKNPSFYLTNNIGVEWDEIWDAVDEITVIGNIYDNPELLEVREDG